MKNFKTQYDRLNYELDIIKVRYKNEINKITDDFYKETGLFISSIHFDKIQEIGNEEIKETFITEIFTF